MQKIQRFEDLGVWQESLKLSIDLYKSLSNCKDFGLKDQIQRAAVSIPSNIAEGYERDTNNDYIRFLNISKASCGELRTQLYIAKATGILTQENADAFIERTKKISSMLYKYINVRKNRFK
ncbi:four helix bundle protein [Prosthecochloris sp. N3]|uniref:Four helix bundle protein n=1 Tax=Prosthecochloris ethylica TaxID=2743976 RepID=A0ABR9XTP5_9CHLB|nr:four helix bundle protein [Prosthecochloris ethylica]MBF0587301.1 four helix bundle protein [Prosthecochloris ethylica]MBF0637437.1 four helix bundle protein [Prosthecochloris ethylica]NUK48582.1 four helix bundle protein [Prosthecochloris ethylica]